MLEEVIFEPDDTVLYELMVEREFGQHFTESLIIEVLVTASFELIMVFKSTELDVTIDVDTNEYGD
ncbi:unnamed protein product [Heterobilharzia americana]|nr:unnamed protein product [Heterobilharzia americana]